MHTTPRSPHRHTDTKKLELIKWNEIWHARYLTVQFYELIFFLHVHSPKRHKIDCVQFAILSPQIYNVDNVCKTRSPQGEHLERNNVRRTFSILPIFSDSRHFIVYVNLDRRIGTLLLGKWLANTVSFARYSNIGKCDPKPKEPYM